MSDYNSILLKWLNKAYDLEMKSFRGYMYAVVTVTGPLHDLYEELYKKFAELEKEHLYEVGEKITALGGEISTACLPIDEIVAAVKVGYDEALSALQKVEDESLELYKQIHKLASAKNDTTMVLLVEHIMEEEQEHYDELQRILMDVPGEGNVELHDELVVGAFELRREKLAGLFIEAGEQVRVDAHDIKSWNDSLAKLNRILNLQLDPNHEWAKEAMFLANMVWGDIATYKHQIKEAAARKEKLAELFVVAEDKALFDSLAAKMKTLANEGYVASQSGDKKKQMKVMNDIQNVTEEVNRAVSDDKLTREERVSLWNMLSEMPEMMYGSEEELPEPPRVNSITQTKAKTPEEAYKAYKLYMNELIAEVQDRLSKSEEPIDFDWQWAETLGLEDAVSICPYPENSPQHKKWKAAITKYHKMEEEAERKLFEWHMMKGEDRAINKPLYDKYTDYLRKWAPPAPLDTNFVWHKTNKQNNVVDAFIDRKMKLASL